MARGRGGGSGRGGREYHGRGCGGREGGRGRGRGGRGAGRGNYGRGNEGRGRGRGRGAGRDGGRGGRGNDGPFPEKVLSNLIPCSVLPGFKFYQYGIECKDKRGKEIESRGRRTTLFNLGMFDPREGHLARHAPKMSKRQVEDLRRVVFFQSSYFFSARPIPGLEKVGEGVPLVGGGDGTPESDEGDALTVTGIAVCSPPEEMGLKQAAPETPAASMQALTLELRCANCVKTFVDQNAMIMHCRETGHFPVTPVKDGGESVRPAKMEEFIQYANVAMRRALGERLARWGREYIDPESGTEPTDKFGNPLGVRVFQAFSCEFGWHKSKPIPNEHLKLALTADLRAKVIRTKSLLDVFCHDQQPEKMRFDARTQAGLKRQWCSEVVIATYDKRCYSVIDLLFDKSPATLHVDDLGMSHADYFRKRKDIKLKYPNACPMVAVNGRNNNKIYLPAELVCGNELDPQLKMKLPTIASFTPPVRLEAIEKIRKFLTPGAQKTKGAGGLLTSLGFVLADGLIKVNVTKLELPIIKVAGLQVPEKMGGMWAPMIAKANYRVNPQHAVELKVVLVSHRTIKNYLNVYNSIRDMVNQHGAKYRFGEKPYKYVQAGDRQDHWGAVEKCCGSKLPNNTMILDFSRPPRGQSSDPAYHVVKSILGKGGHLSQFVNFATYDHANPRDNRRSTIILSGVARQILSKCGVRIWWVNIPRTVPLPAVFVGVDVFHAPRKFDAKAGRRLAKESVAAVIVQIVRSHNPHETVEIYCKTERRSAGKEMELGSVMAKTIRNALRAFNMPSPKCCFVWRDGVGDTSIRQAASQEIPEVRAALTGKVVGDAQMKALVPVPLSYIVCQKRINTKLLAEDGRKVPCGALVTELQSSQYKTFYINGTSPPYSTPKPVRFIIAKRDDPLLPVSPSALSWALCHDYPNWTGPVKLPAPVQMAHKLAELAGGMQDCGESIDHEKYAGKIYFL